MEIGLNLLQIQPFSSAHMFRTLRPCYICDKLSPNLRHPAPLTVGFLGVFIYSKQPYFTSFPEERCSCQICTADLPWESSKQAVGRLLITYNLFSRFCLFLFPLLIDGLWTNFYAFIIVYYLFMQNCSMNILHGQISVWVFVMSFHSIREFWIFIMSNWPSQSHGTFSVPLLEDLTFINYFHPREPPSLDWKDKSVWPEGVFLKHGLLQKRQVWGYVSKA